MGRKGPRKICFVCNAIINSKLVTEVIERNTSEEACKDFETKFSVSPEAVNGPFYRKRMGVLDSTLEINFSGRHRDGVYQGWNVRAMLLDTPRDHAMILFKSHTSGKNMPKPKSTVVRVEDVQF